MAIYVEKNNAALLKSNRSVVELYKGAKKIFGYNYAKGKIVKVDDVHSTQHKLKVNLSSKNLIPYPYTDTTKTVNGITFTDNGDGTITANGTATGLADFTLKQSFLVKKGMCLSGAPEGSSYSTFEIQVYYSAEKYITTSGNGYDVAGEDFDLAVPARIRIRSGYTANNLVFKPLIEYNTIPTEYTPYISDFSGISVTKCGKNLIRYPYYEGTKTKNGVKFTVGNDGAVSLEGTATAMTDLILFYRTKTIFLPKNTSYVISGCPEGGNSSKYRILATVELADGTVRYHNDYGAGGVLKYEQDATITELYIRIANGEITDGLVFKPQLEIGTTATEYEPYKQPQTVTANADGTVEGLTSLTNMTILSDADGVVINCEYVKG